ncbi:MORC family CW-type zinc finger protein 3-like [Argopecten irradians]|uniref:MORC family CW-type zinc finger protein 3-like n=1 Tax=Argopecten irradians TaxID=31199 RepID=UPI003718B740
MAARYPSGIQTSRVSPSYLHGNSTSHTWAFSAVAELIDNAYDPDVNASEIWIDQRLIDNKVCLTFVDNGNGMTPDKLHKMLSFGYCEKDKFTSGKHQAVGQYGNGFKSGSMRLGKDAIVFTRQVNTMSVGLLSQTYLHNINAQTVLVPIVTWNLPDKKRRPTPDMAHNLRAICQHSIFRTEKDLLEELEVMEKLRTGTKIMVYNLKRKENKMLELDFSSDPSDIRNPETHMMDFSTINRATTDHIPAYMVSLREYCSILYLKPRMKIVLRGKKVKTKLIHKSLSQTETDVYKPTWAPKPIPIKFGFAPRKNYKDYGVMLYHKNRLIRAYEKLGYQKQPNELGIGVVGVVEAYFLTPTHNKQDFNKDEKYNALISSVSLKLNDYWNEKRGTGVALGTPGQPAQAVANVNPDWTWAQCDNCLQWRRLPIQFRSEDLPDKWYCHMNPDAQFNRCDIQEEPEDEDEALHGPTYKKTFKKIQNEKKMRLKMMEANQQRAREMALQAREQALRQQEANQIKGSPQSQKVSSSQEKKTENAQMNKMMVELEKFKKQAERQQKIIEQLQSKRKKVDENLERIVGGLDTDKLLGNIAGSSPKTVSSTSSKDNEAICIKTEDGDVVAVIPCNEPSSSSDKDIVDLTLDDEDFEPSTPKKAKISSTNEELKPDISKIKIEKDISSNKRHIGIQTTERARGCTKDCAKKVEEGKKHLSELQRKVYKLLKIIVPDEDIGTADGVEDIVTEMIKHNQPS